MESLVLRGWGLIQQAVTRRRLTSNSLEGQRGGLLGPVKCIVLQGFP